jgi:hypothetical protein
LPGLGAPQNGSPHAVKLFCSQTNEKSLSYTLIQPFSQEKAMKKDRSKFSCRKSNPEVLPRAQIKELTCQPLVPKNHDSRYRHTTGSLMGKEPWIPEKYLEEPDIKLISANLQRKSWFHLLNHRYFAILLQEAYNISDVRLEKGCISRSGWSRLLIWTK